MYDNNDLDKVAVYYGSGAKVGKIYKETYSELKDKSITELAVIANSNMKPLQVAKVKYGDAKSSQKVKDENGKSVSAKLFYGGEYDKVLAKYRIALGLIGKKLRKKYGAKPDNDYTQEHLNSLK